jgi:adenosylcobinamide-GDP ribazoletransferase
VSPQPFLVLRREVGRYFAAQQFLTRIPCPASTPFASADLAGSIAWFSLVGVPVGAVVGGVAVALRNLVTPTFAAVIAVAAGAMVTGAFHEDGFADTCDAFGGYTSERRREIMRDSRVGTFGALGLLVLFVAKVSALGAVLAESSLWRIVVISICAHTISRAATVLAIRFVPPVVDPTSKTKSYSVTWPRFALALFVPAIPLAVAAFRWDAAIIGGAAILIVEGARPFFRRFTDGISGDGLGAVNQVVEVVVWAVAARQAIGR